MDVEKQISDLNDRLTYQEQIHRNVTPDGNRYHTTFIDLRLFCGAVLLSAAISFMLIKIMK